MVRTEYIRPTCQPPVMGEPPFIDSAELWLLVGPDVYDKLEQGMIIRDAHINKQDMMIEVLCEKPAQ